MRRFPIHSVPYQMALGACGVVYMWVWITRMHATKIVDVRHCGRVQAGGSIEEVMRLQHPTTINWTAVDVCDLGPIFEPPIAAASQLGVPPAKTPRPSWYTVSNDDRLLSWREHLLDQAMTLVFFTHLVVHWILYFLEGWRGKTAFSWIAPFTNPLTCVDLLVVVSVLFATSTDENVRDAYSIGGTIRVFLLFHPLFCIEWYLQQRKKKRKYGRISHAIAICVAVLKLLFVCFLGAALMYMSEQPCEVVLDDYRNQNGTCDVQFRTFGHVVYFTFVTLSTVGYGDMSPQTPLGRTLVVFVILFGISYLPSAIADILHMGQDTEEMDKTKANNKKEKTGGVVRHRDEKTKKKRSAGGNIENDANSSTLQLVLDDLRHELKKRDELLLQSLTRRQGSVSTSGRQVGFFQHAGTLAVRGDSIGSSSGDDALATAASQEMASMYAELSGMNEVWGGEVQEQKRPISGELFKAACVRLERMHGVDKIAQCMAVLGLEEQGGDVGVLVQHVLGLTVRPRKSADVGSAQ